MNKIIQIFTLASILHININAETLYPFICQTNELAKYKDSRYFDVGFSTDDFVALIDTKTIKIDRKNKIIETWQIQLLSEKGRQGYINGLGNKFNKVGYLKSLRIYNYDKMAAGSKNILAYGCDGSLIESEEYSTLEMRSLAPDTYDENILEGIMQKYKLSK